jgi:hypothetical protein
VDVQPVNSPVDVIVGGHSAVVATAQGWPGLADTYQLVFTMPDVGASGNTTIQLVTAWVAGGTVKVALP